MGRILISFWKSARGRIIKIVKLPQKNVEKFQPLTQFFQLKLGNKKFIFFKTSLKMELILLHRLKMTIGGICDFSWFYEKVRKIFFEKRPPEIDVKQFYIIQRNISSSLRLVDFSEALKGHLYEKWRIWRLLKYLLWRKGNEILCSIA